MRYASGEPLAGVQARALDRHTDERGYFMEIFKDAWGPRVIDPVQSAVVSSRANVLRGPHLHLNHDEYFMLLSGKAYVGLYDVRPDSPTRGKSCLIEFDEDQPAALLFPRGLLHGWYFPVDSVHIQSVSEAYEDYHPHDNLGCHWADPDLNIPWPTESPIVAARADSFPPLRELLSRIY